MNKFKLGQRVKAIRTGKIGIINQIDDNDIDKYGCSIQCYKVIFKDCCFSIRYTVHDLEEVKEILDLKEKEYLSNIIKPFRNKVEYIRKSCHDNKYFIKIYIKNDSTIVLPDFEKNTMYKCMETDKEYSLKELGLYD